MNLLLPTRRISTAEAERLVPKLCEGLSLARSMIAQDHIRAIREQGSDDRIVAVTVGDFNLGNPPLAAAIAIRALPPSSGLKHADSATMILAGPIEMTAPAATGPSYSVQALASFTASSLDQQLRALGVRFIQWPTDDIGSESMASSLAWCRDMGFEPIATLDYLAGRIDSAEPLTPQYESTAFRLEALDWGIEAEIRDFSDLVAQTYQGTLDCPKLNDFRTVDETLLAYRSVPSFVPSWWFRLRDPHDQQVLGCLILGRHKQKDANGRGDVMELVYMGLIPSRRGTGLGSQLMGLVKLVAQHSGCDYLIASVDRANDPAKVIYERAGLRSWMGETVWVKTLDFQRRPEQLDT